MPTLMSRSSKKSQNLGFSDPFSVNRGEEIVFKIKTDSSDYHVDIFRVGWYGGTKTRVVIILVCDWSVVSNPHISLVDCDNCF